MEMSLIAVLCERLGLEFNEEFTLKEYETERLMFENGKLYRYYAKNDTWEIAPEEILIGIIFNSYEVVKLPYNPKIGQRFWTYWMDWVITDFLWADNVANFEFRKACGCIFRTHEEALKALPVKYKEITGKEWKNENE